MTKMVTDGSPPRHHRRDGGVRIELAARHRARPHPFLRLLSYAGLGHVLSRHRGDLLLLVRSSTARRRCGGEARHLQIDLSRREWLLISLAGSLGLFNAGYVIFISFLPDLFAARGYSLADASRVVSVLAGVIVTVPLLAIGRAPERPNI